MGRTALKGGGTEAGAQSGALLWISGSVMEMLLETAEARRGFLSGTQADTAAHFAGG